ncbi:hypothetical protein C0993_010931 [Termitomyces sp. T159_Od127]|nr:hypothetical protein C0993_010931 [Termitomyces sp. T159_Od127]
MSFKDEDITNILRGFLNDHDMFGTCNPPCATNNELEEFMQNEIEVHGLPAEVLNKILHLSASLIELAYHGCTFEEKKQIALYNWFLIYIDDVSPKDITAYIAFQERFIRKLPQLDPVLDRLASLLHAIYHKESIDGETANYIANRALAEGKAPLQVVSDIQRELLKSRNHILETLAKTEGKEAISIWRTWECGFMQVHLIFPAQQL